MIEKDEVKRETSQLGDGYSHGFEPMKSFDVTQATSARALLDQMSRTAFSGRQLGEALDVYLAMARDRDCFRVMTLSGAMTMAKMSLLICDMIDNGLVDAIVSTGALMSHGLVESAGMTHFKMKPGWDDKKLFEAGYCRVYDTLELEKNLDDMGYLLERVLKGVDPAETMCSHRLCELLGGHLEETTEGRAILVSARRKGVPIFIPAFTDCEMGLDFAIYNHFAEKEGRPTLQFNPFLDLLEYTRLMTEAERVGIFTIGGGVPRNWAQQVGPFVDHMQRVETGVCARPIRFRYGVRLCPEPAYWGGLSGCTYSEGVSWGKFIPPEEGGKFAEVLCDATIAWPVLMTAAFEALGLEGNGQQRV